MYSVGIDISKGKSTICIINEIGEIILSPREYRHNKEELDELINEIKKIKSKDIKIIMEATGIYHHPVLYYLRHKGYFCSAINPLKMKKYINNLSFRGVKTDLKDSLSIAQYGIDNWHHLDGSKQIIEDTYDSMKRLSRQYLTKTKIKVSQTLDLDHQIDQCTPGIKDVFNGYSIATNTDRLSDFLESFWHYDLINRHTYSVFEKKIHKWAKKKGYRIPADKPTKVYNLARNNIPTVAPDEVTKNLMILTITNLKTTNDVLYRIITQLKQLAITLPEYETVRNMSGVGDILAALLIAEIGDIRRFHSADALVAFSGIDVPPYESGQYIATQRHITKKGSSRLRKLLYQVTTSLVMKPPNTDKAVYDFIMKKKSEGKRHKTALVAGMNKFLRIYYARVKEVYKPLEN